MMNFFCILVLCGSLLLPSTCFSETRLSLLEGKHSKVVGIGLAGAVFSFFYHIITLSGHAAYSKEDLLRRSYNVETHAEQMNRRIKEEVEAHIERHLGTDPIKPHISTQSELKEKIKEQKVSAAVMGVCLLVAGYGVVRHCVSTCAGLNALLVNTPE